MKSVEVKSIHEPGNWRGFAKLLMFAFAICAVFVVGGGFELWQHGRNPMTVRQAILYQDFGQLARFREENRALPVDPRRIVFLGDSITRVWDLGESFPGEPYLNRGIDSQTTSQMLVRFRQDVIDLQPASVVILAGTNDLGDTSAAPLPIPDIERNLQTMADLAVAHNIRPIFASVLPVHNHGLKVIISAERSPQSILEVNRWLRSYCAQYGYTYIDYHSALVSPDGMMRKELSEDGIHPNAAGFRIMASIAKNALETKNATK
jgi:lysophospholipase L1-like esterase